MIFVKLTLKLIVESTYNKKATSGTTKSLNTFRSNSTVEISYRATVENGVI